MKTEYTSVELEIIIFETDDVITFSCVEDCLENTGEPETEPIHV